MPPTTDSAAAVREVLLEIRIEAPRARVWKALTDEIDAWWHPGFFAGSNPVAFHLEPKLGGLVYEDWGDGNGLLWGTVIGVRAPEMLQTVGDTSPDWGGPNRGLMQWDLREAEDDAHATVVRFRHSLHGRVTAETVDSLDSGWRLLLEGCLKPYAETGARPEGR